MEKCKTIHINEDCTLEMGYEKIILDKLFGALIFCDLRIYPNHKTCEWVIERQVIDKDSNVFWEEVYRVDGQESIYFHDEKQLRLNQ